MDSPWELELERLTQRLGGGWRIERGVMPLVILTMVEAQRLEARLAELEKDLNEPSA